LRGAKDAILRSRRRQTDAGSASPNIREGNVRERRTEVHPSVHFSLSGSLNVRQEQATSGKTDVAEHITWTKIDVPLNYFFLNT